MIKDIFIFEICYKILKASFITNEFVLDSLVFNKNL